MENEYDLERFISAQTTVYDTALQELAAGRKTSAWMWYIFPMLQGISDSQSSQFYGLTDRGEATAYLAHPVLGMRLIQCTKLAIKHAALGEQAIFGDVDAMKFHSSMTLFSRIKGASPVFESALFAFYGSAGDPRTLRILRLAFTDALDD